MVEFRSPSVGQAPGLRIDSVEVRPTDLGPVLVRVAGAWDGPHPPAAHSPILVLGDDSHRHQVASLPETSGAAARAASEERPFRAAFSVPDRLAGLLRGALKLDLGGVTIDLPAPARRVGEETEQAEGTLVDRAVLVERRARRAELAEAAAGRRAQEAERALARMEADLAALELRLGTADEERAALEVELDRRERELRASRQHAHAEQHLREDEVSAAEQRVGQAERDAKELRQAQMEADRRTRSLEAELATAHRQAAEAHQHTETAMARARRAEQTTRGGEGRRAKDLAVLRSELELASSKLRLAPVAPARASAPDGAQAALLEHERRAEYSAVDPMALGRLRRRADFAARALAEAEGRVAEAHVVAADLEGRLARERHARGRAEVALGERILRLAREANGLRAQADAEQRLREAAQAEARARGRAPRAAEDELAGSPASVVNPGEQEQPPALDEAPRPERPWLAIGLHRLVAENPMAGGRLALELLPGQALVGQPVSYDLLVGTQGWHEVTLGPVGGRVVGRHRPREGGEASFRLTATPATLVALVTEGGSRRLRRRGVRVSGTLRRGRALRSLAAVPLDTGALADSGILIEPLQVHRALALSIEPEWTRGHELCLEHTIEGGRERRCFVTVSDGERVTVSNRPPPGRATTTVCTSQQAFQRALGGRVEGRLEIDGDGDTDALALLVAWARWGSSAADARG